MQGSFHNYRFTGPGAIGTPGLLINAEILTDSFPDLVLAFIVTVLDVLFAPFPLNLTVNFEDSPGRRGALLQSCGTVHPHVALISLTPKG